ncbi:hypothetical protein BKA82DRAFT_536101 [Pisolithus tinctorius]|uniref:Uncharacterized protein n=1 Tax=Pisolithus tinctorius Marx 270 TaxID=870435 RepID=A0A0C3K6J5_PISTI|nr:hypothetical protein BKA82DRAFT_536101 [Pisolithus tinctorius]KIO05217.1 hypothetical protein M404DRAFT_536101 [Pisolithus tinctorius Marx 270]
MGTSEACIRDFIPRQPVSRVFLNNRTGSDVTCRYVTRGSAYLSLRVSVLSYSNISQFLCPQRCVQYIHYRQVLLFVNQTIVCILFMIRTYALYGRSKRLLVFFLLTSLALASPVVCSLVGQQATSATNVPGCQMIYNTNTFALFSPSSSQIMLTTAYATTTTAV